MTKQKRHVRHGGASAGKGSQAACSYIAAVLAGGDVAAGHNKWSGTWLSPRAQAAHSACHSQHQVRALALMNGRLLHFCAMAARDMITL